MAKRKVNRSDLVRQFYADNPGASAGQAVKALAEKGHKVSIALCSQIKRKVSGGAPSRRGRKKKAVRVRQTVAASASPKLSAADLYAAKSLADRLGGIAAAREALDTLEGLQ